VESTGSGRGPFLFAPTECIPIPFLARASKIHTFSVVDEGARCDRFSPSFFLSPNSCFLGRKFSSQMIEHLKTTPHPNGSPSPPLTRIRDLHFFARHQGSRPWIQRTEGPNLSLPLYVGHSFPFSPRRSSPSFQSPRKSPLPAGRCLAVSVPVSIQPCPFFSRNLLLPLKERELAF